ncbi:protein kinase-like domain, Concanavalin A-like lectin/glucanase domain protein [Artemisia annua]|uniref:Protein kinase-like domain, Concanavalin A-like lectin/glucanase domain protein n=1 Tax=Artemisia annua TaxID=35608 RepID=A0A2U1K8L2_ARTAN|nr:protein kinase-like domain, Concanavalin A-like lectin/glucanase domain protein [Artemisia annua]
MSCSGENLESFFIPLEEIHLATQNFSDETKIGNGGFGMVYKGRLSDRWQNRIAAIKRLDPSGYQGKHEYLNELEMVSRGIAFYAHICYHRKSMTSPIVSTMFDQSRQEDDSLKLGDLARTALKVARKLPVKKSLATVSGANGKNILTFQTVTELNKNIKKLDSPQFLKQSNLNRTYN